MPKQDQNRQIIDKILQAVPEKSRAGAKKNIGHIIKALRDEGILTPRTLAYALATVQHETASTFKPIEEYGGRQQAKKLGYEGGENYFGRGFIQLTHKKNYVDMGKKIGIEDLAEHPEKALDPEVSAKILAKFMNERGVAKLADAGDFAGARRPINPDALGNQIANIAQGYLGAIGPDISALTEKIKPRTQPTDLLKTLGLGTPSQVPSATLAPQIGPVRRPVTTPSFGPRKPITLAGGPMVTPGMGQAVGQITAAKATPKTGEFKGFGGPKTQEFGNYNPQLYADVGGYNRGTDIGMKANTPLKAPPGQWQVMEAKTGGWNTGWGNYVLAKNTQTGETIRLSHLNKVDVKPGDIVNEGGQFGISGTTGRTTGQHLDIEFTDNQGQLIDATKAHPEWFRQATQPTTEAMAKPIQFTPAPAASMQMPKQLAFGPQAQIQRASTIQAPSMQVGMRPQVQTTTAPTFGTGFSPQTANVTRSFADIFREGMKTPATPQEQQRIPEQQRQPQQRTETQRTIDIAQRNLSLQRQRQAQTGQPGRPGVPGGIGPSQVQSIRRTSPIVHTVRPGETPSGIAARYGISDWRRVWGGDPRRMPAGATLNIGGGGRRKIPVPSIAGRL